MNWKVRRSCVCGGKTRRTHNHDVTTFLFQQVPQTDNCPSQHIHSERHTRQQSVLNDQSLLDILSSSNLPYSANSSASSFSVALDLIAEAAISPIHPCSSFSNNRNSNDPTHPDYEFSCKQFYSNSICAYPPPRNPKLLQCKKNTPAEAAFM